MKRVLVWDLPTRLSHVLLAGTFLGAFALAELVGDEGPLFPVHVLLGLVAAFVVVARLVWGVVGSAPSRFSSFSLSLFDLQDYAAEVFAGARARVWPGHNPGSSWVAVLIFAGVLGLGVTGVLMSTGIEAVEELHELLAFGTLAVVGAHLAGLALHTVRHREWIALGMVDGRRAGSVALTSARPVAGAVLLGLTAAWAGGLASGFDRTSGTVTLPLLGLTVSAGEGGEGEEEEEEDDD